MCLEAKAQCRAFKANALCCSPLCAGKALQQAAPHCTANVLPAAEQVLLHCLHTTLGSSETAQSTLDSTLALLLAVALGGAPLQDASLGQGAVAAAHVAGHAAPTCSGALLALLQHLVAWSAPSSSHKDVGLGAGGAAWKVASAVEARQLLEGFCARQLLPLLGGSPAAALPAAASETTMLQGMLRLDATALRGGGPAAPPSAALPAALLQGVLRLVATALRNPALPPDALAASSLPCISLSLMGRSRIRDPVTFEPSTAGVDDLQTALACFSTQARMGTWVHVFPGAYDCRHCWMKDEVHGHEKVGTSVTHLHPCINSLSKFKFKLSPCLAGSGVPAAPRSLIHSGQVTPSLPISLPRLSPPARAADS